MIRDRGTMKWTAMMLPEHLKLLKEWKQESYVELPRELAEWELEELQQSIERAVIKNKNIMLTVRENANYLQWSGVIQAIDEENQWLILETITNTKHIPLRKIYAAHLEDDYND